MKKILLFVISVFSLNVFSQGCDLPYQYCPGVTNIPLSTTTQMLNGPQYGCISGSSYATFIYFKINSSGNLLFNVASTDTSSKNISAECWGPLTSPYNVCSNGQITSGNIVDCSYSSTDTLKINNAQSGQYYVIGISWYSGSAQNLIMTQISGTGSIACDTPICNIYNPASICFVSTDSVPHNTVYFSHATGGLKGTIIYRKNALSTWDSIGYVPSSQPDEYIDLTAVPNQQAYTYCTAQIDSCGNKRTKSHPSHTTILLQSGLGTSGQINLSWSAYIGINVPYYYIYRGATPQSLSLLTQVSSSTYAYTDLSPLSGNNYYKVAFPVPNCTSNATHDTLVTSNYRTSSGQTTSINYLNNQADFNIYPNPAKNNVTVHCSEIVKSIEITDVLGNTVLTLIPQSNTETVNVQNLNKGIYFVKSSTTKGVFCKKLLIE